jgi:leucyl-tRNA---protein transferase
MNKETGHRLPSFYLTDNAPCPYIDGNSERKIFTYLVGDNADEMHNRLTQNGFRRSQSMAYRPACEHCTACRSVRVCVNAFKLSKNMKRVLAHGKNISRHVLAPDATREQYDLLRRYLDTRHLTGGMSEMTSLDYIAMIEETAVDTQIVEYRSNQGHLIACLLRDRLNDGFSLVYTFFAPDMPHLSLGTLVILDQIQEAKTIGLPYIYLGYFINDVANMAYKSRFRPLEELTLNGWEPLRDMVSSAFMGKRSNENVHK